MIRLIALVALTMVAIAIAVVLQRRRPDPPTAPSYRSPTQLDRDDFVNSPGQLLVVLFASATCDTCPRAWEAIEAVLGVLAGAFVAQRVDVQLDPELHQRYRIDGVPTTIVADENGVVVQAFFGPITPHQLTEALVA
ncbi:MAG: thioredoxin family protein, partial [Actinomycetia bacterium]|nr:thioredoxin family protein [Actinomycetes bacterium]